MTPEPDDWCNDPANGWALNDLTVQPRLSGGASIPAPDFYLRSVAKASTAHGVPSDGEPKQAGATDARMMHAAITSDPWLLLTSGR